MKEWDWLFMLNLGGGNDLALSREALLTEVTRVGSSDRVAIVAEVDPIPPRQESLRGMLLRGRRDMRSIGVTTNGPAEIIAFVDDAKSRFEARKRALILWDHGNGWQNVHVFDQVIEALTVAKERHGMHAIHGHDEPAQSSFVGSLRQVLDPSRDISIIGFDACLMSMIEVAFQLRHTAQFMVGSQHLVPASTGWAYDALLRALTMNPKMDPEELARIMVDTFAGSYNGADDAVTLTALRLSSEVDHAVAAIDAFSRALLAAISESDKKKMNVRDEIVYARRFTQSFGNADYIDLLSFCRQIRKRLPTEEQLLRTVSFVESALDRLIVRHTRSGAASISDASGVSIYFPHPVRIPEEVAKGTIVRPPIVDSYKQLDFANDLYCRWLPFLETIMTGKAVEVEHLNQPMPVTEPPEQTGCECCHCGTGEDDGEGDYEAPRVSANVRAMPRKRKTSSAHRKSKAH